MARPSKIDRLPSEIREQIADLRSQGRTLDEILSKLRELNADVSRSGLGRHLKGLDQLGEQLHHSRAVADALVKRFGDAPESRQARLNLELMHSLITRAFIASQDGETVQYDPEETMFLARALKDLGSAAKLDVELQLKIRKEATAKAADAAARAGKANGLSSETVAAIRAEILGVVK